MKNSHIILAALAALSSAQFTTAQTSLNITGSSAFRASATNAILNVFGTSGNSLTGYGYTGASATGATYQIFKGNISGMSNPVTIKTQWSGSVAGIRDVSNNLDVSFLPDTTATSPSGTSGASNSGLVAGKAEIAFADNLQSSTNFTANTLNNQNKVGIIPFAFVVGKDAVSRVTNVSAQSIKSLLSAGSVKASQITGNSSDTQLLFAGGRDVLSGTRIAALAETGFGVANSVTQYVPTVSNNTVSSITLQSDGGNSGESSGGNLANYARYTTTNVTDNSGLTTQSGQSMAFIIYVGEADSYAAVYNVGGGVTGGGAGNGRYLTYEGVAAFGGVAKASASTTVTAGSPVISIADATGVIPGQIVSGNGITGGSVVVSISGNSLTLDKNAITTGTPTNVRVGALLPAAIRQGSYPFWNYEYISYKTLTSNKQIFATALENRVRNFDFGFSGLADDDAQTVSRTEDGGILLPK